MYHIREAEESKGGKRGRTLLGDNAILRSLKFNAKVRLIWIPPTKFKHLTEAPGNPLEAFSSLKVKHVNWDITVTDMTGASLSRMTRCT